MSAIVTLAERHRRKIEQRRLALADIDAALAAYARQHGGRFIRFGSSATGRMALHSDVDIIADFPDDRSIAAASFAEALCAAQGLAPDPWPIVYVSERLLARALAEGIVLR